ncbi:hypothetical protein RhiirA4_486319 [Rhizophagus irregularis]|uniref:Uncharacterized protein n=1 Tax=Rhizophagus irregularis TaxID=588596 RepID=A0A2I1HRI0_9GLOM|nr:hypothetical protein RhiirA4_486319 [Rhizophagus irregularis]
MKNTLLHCNQTYEYKLNMELLHNLTLCSAFSFTLEDPNFINFRNKLKIYICEQVGLVYQKEYNLAYKSSTESGAETLLDNEEAFSEFIKDYQTIILGNKKAIIIVTLKNYQDPTYY